METTLDTGLLTPNNNKITYGAFWPRLGALFIDGLIIAPFSVGLTYLNAVQLKSIPFLILLTIIGAAYKPFCEYNYGATPGKMVLKLKVVNLDYEKANLTEVILRNIFGIIPTLLGLILTISFYHTNDFANLNGFIEYSASLGQIPGINYVNWVTYSSLILDLIFLLSDKQKRSLHDRIGSTYVISQP